MKKLDRYEIMKEYMPINAWIKWETLAEKDIKQLRNYMYWLVDHGWVEYESPAARMCVRGARFKLRKEQLIVPQERLRRVPTAKASNGASSCWYETAQELLNLESERDKLNVKIEKLKGKLRNLL